MSDAYEDIRRRVVAVVEEKGLDVVKARSAVRAVVSEAVDSYQRRAHVGRNRALADPAGMVDRGMPRPRGRCGCYWR